METGGTPLEDFQHPLDAVYILGSEDTGLPTAIQRVCHDTISLSSENYASYNVAVAGSLIMYHRMAQLKLAKPGAPHGHADPCRASNE